MAAPRTPSLVLVLLATAVLLAGAPAAVAAQACDSFSHTLWAGQHIDAGEVVVFNDEVNLYVWYRATPDWTITETHLEVSTSLAGIPQTKKGNPIPGRFSYKTTHTPGVSEFIHVVPRVGIEDETVVYIAAHAVVTSPSQGTETGGAGEEDFPGANWATYFTYTLCSGIILE